MATIQELNEPIDVVTVFRKGRMAPVKFRWGGRTYPVTHVAYRWVTRQGAYPVHHFSITTQDSQLYEIVLNTQTMQWSLLQVQMEG
ncbi:MAG TPA: hypothetical protein VNE39_07950 [Planctomycetota bacterium]|nr:hypothetical protein [Planctomycetota bacterium]